MYITHPTHGAGTRQNATANGNAEDHTESGPVHASAHGRRRGEQADPPPKKKGGEGGGRENGPQPPNRPPTPQEAAKPPTQKAPKTGPPNGHRGTTRPKPATPSQERRPTEKKDTKNTQTHATRKKKKSQQPSPTERGWGDRDQRARDREGQQLTPQSQSKKRKKNKHQITPPIPNQKNGGAQPRPGPSTHTHTANPGQERRGTSGARAQTRTPAQHPQPGGAGDLAGRAHQHTHTPTPPKEWRGAAETQTPARTPAPHTETGNGGAQAERARNHARPKSKRKPKPNHTHHKPQPAEEGPHHKPYPNKPARDPSQDWQGYLNPQPIATRTQTQTPHNSRKPSVHSPGTEAARAMRLTRPNEIRSPGVRLHPKACAALGLDAERATPKHLGTLVPRTCMHALGTGFARKSGDPLGLPPKEGTCASTKRPPSRRDKHVTPAAISPPGVAQGRSVGGQQSGLAGSKPPPLFTRGPSSCSSQGRHQGEPWGASPRPSAPTYLPTYLGPHRHSPTCGVILRKGGSRRASSKLPTFPNHTTTCCWSWKYKSSPRWRSLWTQRVRQSRGYTCSG